MVKSCSVVNCKNNSTKNKEKNFYRITAVLSENHKSLLTFVKEKEKEKTIKLSIERQKCWIRALKRDVFTPSQLLNARVCGDHFISGYWFRLFFISYENLKITL